MNAKPNKAGVTHHRGAPARKPGRYSPWITSQFSRPRGLLGPLAGWIMATRPSNRERNQWTLSLLDIQPEQRVLEVGFGPGLAIEQASALAYRGGVVGIDHSRTMLAQATRRNAAAIREGRVRLLLTSVSDLPPLDGPFDKILAVNTVQFWEDPGTRLRKLWELLKPGGRIALTLQPRWRGATERDALAAGERLMAQLKQAGFAAVRLEIKALRPVAAVCALGERPPE